MTIRIAIFTDIHANLPALQATLHAIKQEGCDMMVHTGDVISIGPYPAETLDLFLQQPNLTAIMGNHDAYFAFGPPEWAKEDEHLNWTHQMLDPQLRSLVARWPYRVQQTIEGVRLTFLHYGLTPEGDNFLPIVQEPTPAAMDQLFKDESADLLFYGHHHPFSDMLGKARYVNPGSLGCYTHAIARYAMLTIQNGRYTLQHKTVTYDDSELLRAFEQRQVAERELILQSFFGGRAPA
uniref:Phosphoesterase n=1 Tax=Thermosporothrix sp. COM3 TaxID=2490863 RepID=A0A455SKU6_9CHLR|nr:hypothetical protein KTC_23300 [Thermosporothrix sp. COM3]